MKTIDAGLFLNQKKSSTAFKHKSGGFFTSRMSVLAPSPVVNKPTLPVISTKSKLQEDMKVQN